MKCQKQKSTLQKNSGMTLIEVLVAMAVLMIAVLTFLPLGQSSFENIFRAGKQIKENYAAVGLMEKLIGNDGANGYYECRTDNIPLEFHAYKQDGTKDVSVTPLKAGKDNKPNKTGLQSIDGSELLSTPEHPGKGFSTFICDSVTASMVAFPTHIADDFMKKRITLYAIGFHFANDATVKLFCTPEGLKLPGPTEKMETYVSKLKEVNKEYYEFKVDKKNASVAYLTLKGDNDQINFTHSPLYITYGNNYEYCLRMEIDAPTVIMVGERASDGNYYYYVTNGEPILEDGTPDEENGEIRIIRKVMKNKDPLNRLGTITLNHAMNDIEWVGPHEGYWVDTDGKIIDNKYGYYQMCGDDGEIHRFFKDTATGNYAWGGDYTKQYRWKNGKLDITNELLYSCTVDGGYSYYKPTNENPDTGEAEIENILYTNRIRPNAGIDLMYLEKAKKSVFNRLFVQNAFSVNVIDEVHPKVTVADNMFYMDQRKYTESTLDKKNDESAHTADKLAVDNWFTTNFSSGYMAEFNIKEGKNLTSNPPTVANYPFKPRRAVQQIPAEDMTSYKDYQNLDPNVKNNIVLTAVDTVKISPAIGSQAQNGHPHRTYTLYCGYIPAVMEIWATDGGVRNNGPFTSEWRATLGIAFQDEQAKNVYYHPLGKVLDRWHGGGILYSDWGIEILNGHIWHYGDTTAGNYAISGVCGPENYGAYRYKCPRCGTLLREDQLAEKFNSISKETSYKCLVCGKESSKKDIDAASKGVPNPCAGLWASLTEAEKQTKGGAYGDKKWSDFPMPLNANQYQDQMQLQNETEITVSYLSHPKAFDGRPLTHNMSDLSPSRASADSGVYEWCFDQSATIIDADTINYVDDLGNDRYISIAVGYTVSGLAYENQALNDKVHEISVPTVMNNGIVFIRAGGKNGNGLGDTGVNLQEESNVFHEFYTTNDYYGQKNNDWFGNENTMQQAVSAGYWRDVYHPMFYSVRGGRYNPERDHDKFNYMMSHILNDKRLNCVCWGEQWNGAPEAMWGASDGTMMDWEYDSKRGNTNRVDAEFQSYQRLKYANEYQEKYGNTKFYHQWLKAVSSSAVISQFTLPTSFSDLQAWPKSEGTVWVDGKGEKTENPVYCNAYLDKRSWLLETQNETDHSKNENKSQNSGKMVEKYGFVSPLDTIEDLEYANDTWVAVGVQGLANPITEKIAGKDVKFCSKDAVLQNDSVEGSWVCVRTWLNQGDSKDRGPTEKNNKYIWQAVQVTAQKNVNIEQISYSNGMWYAMGYYDVNENGQYDLNSGETAMMFYARDPQKPCGGKKAGGGWDGGWRLCDTKGSGYTQAYYYNKSKGDFDVFDIDGINSVASRND